MLNRNTCLSPAMMAYLMPMHAVVDATGHVLSTGPTLAKIWPDAPIVGQRILEVFYFRRPHIVCGTMEELRALAPTRVFLETRDERRTRFKGAMSIIEGRPEILLNLSFGISAIPAIRHFGLTNSDFAPTDLTIEMLYLREAKSAMTTELRKLAARLEGSLDAAQTEAETDPLTGLGNRRAMEKRFENLINSGREFALFHLDLDFFKTVNDRLGHAAGDHVLLEVAGRLRHAVRTTDMVARVGGDEFVLLLEGMKDENRVGELAAEIIAEIERPIHWGAEVCRISGSVGFTLSQTYEVQVLSVMVDDADKALYEAKEMGKGRAIAYSSDRRAH